MRSKVWAVCGVAAVVGTVLGGGACVPRGPLAPTATSIHVERLRGPPEVEVAGEPSTPIYDWVTKRCSSQSEPSPNLACAAIAEVRNHYDAWAGQRVQLNAFVTFDPAEGVAEITDGIPPYEKPVVSSWTLPPCATLGHFIVEADVGRPFELHGAVVIGVAERATSCDVAPCKPREGCPER